MYCISHDSIPESGRAPFVACHPLYSHLYFQFDSSVNGKIRANAWIVWKLRGKMCRIWFTAQRWMPQTGSTTVSVLYIIRTWHPLIIFIEVTVFALIQVLIDSDNPCEHQMFNWTVFTRCLQLSFFVFLILSYQKFHKYWELRNWTLTNPAKQSLTIQRCCPSQSITCLYPLHSLTLAYM